jgi:hypothetical protein
LFVLNLIATQIFFNDLDAF